MVLPAFSAAYNQPHVDDNRLLVQGAEHLPKISETPSTTCRSLYNSPAIIHVHGADSHEENATEPCSLNRAERHAVRRIAGVSLLICGQLYNTDNDEWLPSFTLHGNKIHL